MKIIREGLTVCTPDHRVCWGVTLGNQCESEIDIPFGEGRLSVRCDRKSGHEGLHVTCMGVMDEEANDPEYHNLNVWEDVKGIA